MVRRQSCRWFPASGSDRSPRNEQPESNCWGIGIYYVSVQQRLALDGWKIIVEDLFTRAREILAGSETVALFSGAGLSAESGISTFRDTETDALWSRFDPYRLASPEGFADNPGRVIDWYNWRRERLAAVRPNQGHVVLARQECLIQITQNVDDLLERAGVAAENIYHLHGTITRDRCNRPCGYEESVDLGKASPLRRCPECGSLMRPAVVWFGEALPEGVMEKADRLCRRIDCLLVVGTSASVYPAAGLIGVARGNGASIIVVNTHKSEASGMADVELVGCSGEILPELLADIRIRSQ